MNNLSYDDILCNNNANRIPDDTDKSLYLYKINKADVEDMDINFLKENCSDCLKEYNGYYIISDNLYEKGFYEDGYILEGIRNEDNNDYNIATKYILDNQIKITKMINKNTIIKNYSNILNLFPHSVIKNNAIYIKHNDTQESIELEQFIEEQKKA